jgi:hypothetical protein
MNANFFGNLYYKITLINYQIITHNLSTIPCIFNFQIPIHILHSGLYSTIFDLYSSILVKHFMVIIGVNFNCTFHHKVSFRFYRAILPLHFFFSKFYLYWLGCRY